MAKKNAVKNVPATVPAIPVWNPEITSSLVDAATASNMLDVIKGHAAQAHKARLASMIAVYEFRAKGGFWAIDAYKGDGEAGFEHAISDIVNGPQRPAESDDDYRKRWSGFRSTAHNMARAGYLLSFLSRNDWETDIAIRPHQLSIIAKVVGHAAMKGDANRTCSVASTLIDRVHSGELMDQGKLRAAVAEALGESNGLDAATDDKKTVMVSVKASGLSDEQIKVVKAHAEATMRAMIAAMGGKA